jgi:hypothetical protein
MPILNFGDRQHPEIAEAFEMSPDAAEGEFVR